MRKVVFLSFILLHFAFCETESEKFARLFNEWRLENEKPAIPLSKALFTVAQYHVNDFVAYPPPEGCGEYSWSEHGGDLWDECCFFNTSDFDDCMFDVPA